MESQKEYISELFGISTNDIEKICENFKEYIKRNEIEDIREFLVNRRTKNKEKIKKDKLKKLLRNGIEGKIKSPLKMLGKLFLNDESYNKFMESLNDKVKKENNLTWSAPRSRSFSFWTTKEVKQLQSNLDDIVEKYKILNPKDLFFDKSDEMKRLKRDINFKELLAEGIPDRTQNQVFQKIYYMIQKTNVISKWTEEEVTRLLEIKGRLRSQWILIGEELNRHPNDCRTKYRTLKSVSNHERKTGPWSKSECKRLRRAVRALTNVPKNTFVFENIPWNRVCEIVKTRNALDCRRHWLFTFSYIKRDDIREKFNSDIFYRLIDKIEKICANYWKDIDWKSFWLKYDQGNFTPSPPALAVVMKRYIRRKSSIEFTAEAKMTEIISLIKTSRKNKSPMPSANEDNSV